MQTTTQAEVYIHIVEGAKLSGNKREMCRSVASWLESGLWQQAHLGFSVWCFCFSASSLGLLHSIALMHDLLLQVVQLFFCHCRLGQSLVMLAHQCCHLHSNPKLADVSLLTVQACGHMGCRDSRAVM